MDDPKLAAMMQRLNPPVPVERIVETNIYLTCINRLNLAGRRVVELACGHRTVTANSHRARCPECHRMILNGEDYEAFRHGRTR